MLRKNIFYIHLFVAASTLLLILAGGLVTSTGSGLSVPDWPLSYGSFFPPMIGGIRFEHSHRVIAGFVGICTLLLSTLIQATEKRRWVKLLGWGASLAVLAQAALGGLTVIYLLPPAVSVAHACLAQSFFSLICCLTLFQSREWIFCEQASSVSAKPFQRLIITTAIFAYLQLIAGAIVRHTGGKALGIHLFGAFMIFIHTLFILIKSSKDDATRMRFQSQSLLIFGLVLFQLFLGLGSFVFKYYVPKTVLPTVGEILFTTGHQTLGAAILMNLIVMSLRSLRLLRSGEDLDSSSEYLDLMKLKIILLASITTGVGFYLGSKSPVMDARMFHVLMGAFLVGGGANALNQYIERDIDKKMKRTESRPIPSGKLKPLNALIFGWVMGLVGFSEIAFFVGGAPAILSAAIFVGYAFIYTPLKKITTLNTYVGAIAGALPILLGWVAATNTFTRPEGWALFALLFVWQLPHFYAIAWLYRDDYRNGGLRMMPVYDQSGKRTSLEILIFTTLLVLVSLIPYGLKLAGKIYLLGAMIAGVVTMACVFNLIKSKLGSAKAFISWTITYLVILVILLVLNKV